MSDPDIELSLDDDQLDVESIPDETEVYFFGMDLGNDDRTMFATLRKTNGELEIIDTIEVSGTDYNDSE
jgi:hypothetical protein